VIRHHFTVDVEEYFQVEAFSPYVTRDDWSRLSRRADVGVRSLLDILAAHDTRATFFVLAWVAERDPGLVRSIAASGHEIASHGTDHTRVVELKPELFRDSVRSSKQLLEDCTGCQVFGYRAPSFSIVRGAEWALDILVEEEYRYDSSLFPVRRAGYGYENGQRDPHVLRTRAGLLHEIPPATLRLGSMLLPAAGGAYLRHLPDAFVRSAIASAERRGVPATFYVHPWELDHRQPRIQAPILTRIRHYRGLGRMSGRIRRLLSRFSFQPIATTLGLHPLAGDRAQQARRPA
jgi:polysaccharide deacetylase family protein (PEP-CTERM system associated)